MQNSNLENSTALCRALWEHTNCDLRNFIQTYQQYISKNDIHDLLDKLLVTNEHETTDDVLLKNYFYLPS